MLSVCIPCYKEAENLDVLLPRLIGSLADNDIEAEIILMDTSEPLDNTADICAKHSGMAEKIYIKHMQREGGNLYGDAIRTIFKKATGDRIIIMDADGSHSPEDCVKLYNCMCNGNYDIVIGSRYIKGGKTDNPLILVFMSYILNITYRLFFHLNVYDVSDSFRIYNTSVVKALDLQCDNFDIVEEILILANIKQNLNIKEIPILFNKRMYGESKRDLIKFIFSYIGTISKLKKIQRMAKK